MVLSSIAGVTLILYYILGVWLVTECHSDATDSNRALCRHKDTSSDIWPSKWLNLLTLPHSSSARTNCSFEPIQFQNSSLYLKGAQRFWKNWTLNKCLFILSIMLFLSFWLQFQSYKVCTQATANRTSYLSTTGITIFTANCCIIRPDVNGVAKTLDTLILLQESHLLVMNRRRLSGLSIPSPSGPLVANDALSSSGSLPNQLGSDVTL